MIFKNIKLKNTKENYGAISKGFHWAIAIIILVLVLVGFYMESLVDSPGKFQIYSLHKSFGLMVLYLAALRIIWRFYTKLPAANEDHKKWEKFFAKIIHIFLYIAMLGMPITGWVMSSASGYSVPFFGIQMPDIVSKNNNLAMIANKAHTFTAYLLITAIMLHAFGALKHHIIDSDLTLKRMLPNTVYSLWLPVIIIVLVVFSFGVLKLGVIDKFSAVKEADENIENTQELDLTNKQNLYNVNEWNIVKEQSQIRFSASLYNKSFTGIFSYFDGTIIFDPDSLSDSEVDIKINIKSVDSRDASRDSNMLGEEWFNVADYPMAYFKTIEFQQVSDNNYVTVGNLTIAGKTMPISFPFTLDIIEDNKGRRAYVEGQFNLNRLDFDLGGDQWESADSVSHQVQVNIRLVAENINNSAN